MLSNMASKVSRTAEQLRRAIREAERAGLTRYQISKKSGVSQALLTRIVVTKTGNPRLDIAERIASAIGWKLSLTRQVDTLQL
jgi:hypothetical protein